MKRITAALLVVVTLLTASVTAFAAPSFPDITDLAVARDVAVLQMLGIISGDENGYFNPNNTLTRAQFCKMAIIVMGKDSLEPQYRNRTIFPDVRASHWAVGFINLAVTGDNKILSGFPDGTFRPESAITCAQAVTILMRVLGYTDEDAGFLWPEGYMDLATTSGLLAGISASADDTLKRSQAARLFTNMLDANNKTGNKFISTIGTLVPNALVIELDAQMPDGTTGAVRTTAGTYLPKNGVVPSVFLGMRGTLVTDAAGRLLTFLPMSGDSKVITVESAGATYLRTPDGTRYSITGSTVVYTPDGATTYDLVYLDIRPGSAVTLYFSSGGTVDAIYANNAPATEALVLTTGASKERLDAFAGTTNYTIYKNGAPAVRADIYKYDVLTYDSVANRIEASDFRFSGAYENASPNLETPKTVKMLGQTFDVIPSAHESLSQFRLGDKITLLFTADMQVAGAVSSDELFTNAIGIVLSASTTSATVRLLNGIELSGNPRFSDYEAGRMTGEFVTVYAESPGRINVARLPGPGASQPFNVQSRVVDGYDLLPYVRVFDRVGKTGYITQVNYTDLTQSVIPADRVLYVGRDSSGRVHTLVLNDVTGDLYTYGFLSEEWFPNSVSDTNGNMTTYNIRAVAVSNGSESAGPVASGACEFSPGPGGLAVSITNNAAGTVMLTEIKNVSRSAFSTDANGRVTLTLDDGVKYPVATNVRCYNATTKLWFDSLTQARAFAATMSVYVDRAPEDGGKVRLVFAA